MQKIQISEFPFDRTIFPESLYGNKPYRVGNIGFKMARSIKEEADHLIQEFLAASSFETQGVYLRLDFFIDPSLEAIHLLEVNSRLVDGWGAALSLARAGGQGIEELSAGIDRAQFPSLWHLPFSNRLYRNDFDFALRELNQLGASVAEVKELGATTSNDWVYYYGWDRPGKNASQIAPSLGSSWLFC
jgi:hypothetical protein